MQERDSLEYYFVSTGFYDLLPVALNLIRTLGFTHEEAVEAICKVADKARMYPPTCTHRQKTGQLGSLLYLKKNYMKHGLKFSLTKSTSVHCFKLIITGYRTDGRPGYFYC